MRIVRSAFPPLLLLASCVRHVKSGVVATGDFTSPGILAEDLRRRVETLAADSMMGRETGSEGDYKAAEYVAAQFRRLGLQPAGENGTYFQTVPFWTVAVERTSQITLSGSSFRAPQDFLPVGPPITIRTLSNVPTVFGGIVDDQSHWIAADAARGRVVVLAMPANVAVRGFPINLARWPGAAAVAVIGLEHTSPEQAARLTEGRPLMSPTLDAGATPTLWISRRVAAAAFGSAASPAPGTVGQAVSGRFGYVSKPVAFPARNVIAILPGSDPAVRGEYVAVTAHHDHVGFDRTPVDHDSIRAVNRIMRPMGADTPVRDPNTVELTKIRSILDSLRRARPARQDSIRNGADDDGSGTASILEIAETMATGERPRRSILFVSHVAEEAGLRGSAWYTDHATVPTDSIVAELDQDMVGRGLPDDLPRGADRPAATNTYLEVVGDQKISREFSQLLDAANARQPTPFVFDRTYAAPGHPLQYYCRADHYNYARYGIPSVAVSRGEHLDYHQVTDEAEYMSYPDLARVSRMIYDAVMTVANLDHRLVLDVPKPADPHAPCRQ